MNILLLASHAIAEFDDLRMLSDLGYDVFCPGGYADPAHPTEAPATKEAGMGPLRPGLPLPYHADLDALCTIQRELHKDESEKWAIDWAKKDLHPDLVDWADAIIVHHFPERWIAGQWKNIRHKRVIWRTCGQSGPDLEDVMLHYAKLGMQIVRYSPKERNLAKYGAFAGEDAMIRFGKYPADWYGWTCEDAVVGNLTQSMTDRAEHTGYRFWKEATEGLPTRPAGGGSEDLPNGVGLLSYDGMREYLRRIRVFFLTGTAPASYTLAPIEAMLTGTPVVSVKADQLWPIYRDLYEGEELTTVDVGWSEPRFQLRECLADWEFAERLGGLQRQRALDLFSVEKVGPQWLDFLGSPTRVTVQHEMATVTA